MAITLFHRIININNNHIRIVNNSQKKEQKKIRVSGDIKTKKHTITESKNYD